MTIPLLANMNTKEIGEKIVQSETELIILIGSMGALECL